MAQSKSHLSFSIDPQLASLLRENYRSIEEALKELVDNAHDADAENVWISLPAVFTERPEVVVKDGGTGMKEAELESEYLKIARSRLSRKGSYSQSKRRFIKGRKGLENSHAC